ncbi:Fumarate hydratase class II [Klebsiella pneumoniae IS43]|uniref:Fumarate hydratase class II n=1 Tax=Klebsiella pneumoniae IS43 TaxID=1432552 RepID=W1DLC8_KLEPN|nr:Fumarate hydratase class II [Klebsiella pneumoniae IS43]
MTTHRSEKDSMGAIEVPADKLWGAQTQRSLEHFRISTEKKNARGADIRPGADQAGGGEG